MSKKITELDGITSLELTDILPVVINPDSLPENKKITVSGLFAPTNSTITGIQTTLDRYKVIHCAEGRLTPVSATPVTTSDATAVTTIYYTPFIGNCISLYDGVNWNLHIFSELSLSLAGLTANKNFDIFIYDNSGTRTLEALVWTNDTTRATNLVRQDGVLVKTGELTKRYLGTIRTTGTIGQTEDSLAKRYIWNLYNQSLRVMQYADATSHTYTSSARYWNADANARVDFVLGYFTNPIYGAVRANILSDGTALVSVGYGLDVSNSMASGLGVSTKTTQQITAGERTYFPTITTVGYHFIALLEARFGSGTGTFTSGQLNVEVWG